MYLYDTDGWAAYVSKHDTRHCRLLTAVAIATAAAAAAIRAGEAIRRDGMLFLATYHAPTRTVT